MKSKIMFFLRFLHLQHHLLNSHVITYFFIVWYVFFSWAPLLYVLSHLFYGWRFASLLETLALQCSSLFLCYTSNAGIIILFCTISHRFKYHESLSQFHPKHLRTNPIRIETSQCFGSCPWELCHISFKFGHSPTST